MNITEFWSNIFTWLCQLHHIKTVNFHFQSLRSIRRSITKSDDITIDSSYILPHFVHNNLLIGLFKDNILRLQMLQNSIVRCMYHNPRKWKNYNSSLFLLLFCINLYWSLIRHSTTTLPTIYLTHNSNTPKLQLLQLHCLVHSLIFLRYNTSTSTFKSLQKTHII